MIRVALIALLALPLAAQAAARPAVPTEDSTIQRFRAHAKPRPVAPRAPLTAEERNTIRRFREAKPSVVFISAFLPNPDPKGPPKLATGSGTGFVWDEWGHIVTNRHVIGAEVDGKLFADVTEVEITLADGKTYKGRVIGRSYAYDIAVIQAFAPLEAMRPIPLGQRSNLQVGQTVLAIGNPFGLDHSLSRGVISALGREISTGYSTWTTNSIQTDAAINPGNSGGPLLDTSGRLIGMNTAIVATRSEGSVGVGFALPVDTLNNIVPRLISKGKIETLQMGFTTLTPFEADQAFGIKRGLVVNDVDPGTPAARAGLRPLRVDKAGQLIAMGDILLAFEGVALTSAGQFKALLEWLTMVQTGLPPEQVVFDVLRDGQVIKVVLDLREPPASGPMKAQPASI
ncbi:MAG: trypsin-like peptidase domain-containing protein [Holophagaceae bacterium]|uniref:Trypsin-like peptidase domain-containing protein n=1 Tax=Candidatus Geothrix skivensis TaxID=2954439 RepID=A0A9D7SII4_9BACT|nr:trypsin-like peptidase domain-containing protein [Candidatus Geothrix skivensis]